MKTLLEKVRDIDEHAANYIESEVLPVYKLSGKPPPDNLLTLFNWYKTPQYMADSGYWLNIYLTLIKGE